MSGAFEVPNSRAARINIFSEIAVEVADSPRKFLYTGPARPWQTVGTAKMGCATDMKALAHSLRAYTQQHTMMGVDFINRPVFIDAVFSFHTPDKIAIKNLTFSIELK